MSKNKFFPDFFTLEMSCAPGGINKTNYFKYKTLNQVKKTLKNELSNDHWSPYELLCYGENIILYQYKDNKCINKINLLPYFTIDVQYLPSIKINEKGENIFFYHNRRMYCDLNVPKLEKIIYEDYNNVKDEIKGSEKQRILDVICTICSVFDNTEYKEDKNDKEFNKWKTNYIVSDDLRETDYYTLSSKIKEASVIYEIDWKSIEKKLKKCEKILKIEEDFENYTFGEHRN